MDPELKKTEKPRRGDQPAESPLPKGKAGDDLSAEEQMALYEESLKESDWGHQPC